jgi:metallophosphoesterase (TIGR00282 family)
MNILYIGDVMGEVGMQVVEKVLPSLRREHHVDLVIAQVENVTQGKGIIPKDFRRLQAAGVDFGTGGNWSLFRDEVNELVNNPEQPIIRPANYPKGTAGLGYKYVNKVLVISLLGQIVGKDANKPVDNPLQVIDAILDKEEGVEKTAVVVNFHGDYSSEKVVIGHYLDGRVTAVVGDHWHVPTADARVLPGGTAHITDVGMCGVLDASLGVAYQSVIPRWRDEKHTRNALEVKGRRQFNAVLVRSNARGLADEITQIQKIL